MAISVFPDEASVQGTSAKGTEMTAVVLESPPHKMQNQLHSPLPLTSRLPIEGKPNVCKQEVVESVVTAGCTNGMAKMANPTEITGINRTALLGGEPVERVCRVDKGNGEREPQSWLQEMKSLCKEIIQCSGNANRAISDAYRLLLEGEWTVCASGKASDSEHDADTSNELTEPLTTTIKPDDADGGGMLSMYLGGMRWHAGNVSRPEGQLDGSGCQTDGPNGQADGLRALERPLRQMLRARELLRAMVIEAEVTELMAMWMAQLAVAALTQIESKQHCWL